MLYFIFYIEEKSKVGDLRDYATKKDIDSSGVNAFGSHISSTTSSSPNPSLAGSISMPPLFPRPSIASSIQGHDNFGASSESVISPSSSHPLYSPSFPLLGHRYFSALNHAATATSLLPHQRNIHPLMRNLNGPAATYLSNNSGLSSATQSSSFAKSVFAARGRSPSSSQSIEELSSHIFTQVI